jgi:asparagine synthetase B (glutamine-hydrolysing)
MASSTEFRFPYLDHRLIEFSVQIPPSFKFNGTRKKYVLQEVAKDLLPEKIVYRRKFPFGIPIMRYFKKDFIHVVDSLLDKKTIAKRPYLNGHGITKLIDGVKKMEIGKLDKIREIKDSDLRKLLLLTNLELWQRMFIENDDMYKPSMKIEDYL